MENGRISDKRWAELVKECRPCPFCEGKSAFAQFCAPEIEQYRVHMWTGKKWLELNDRSLWRVMCGCGGMGPHMGSPELAVAAWNGSLNPERN